MWGPWMSANFGLRRPHIVDDNVSIREIVAMWDSMKDVRG